MEIGGGRWSGGSNSKRKVRRLNGQGSVAVGLGKVGAKQKGSRGGTTDDHPKWKDKSPRALGGRITDTYHSRGSVEDKSVG